MQKAGTGGAQDLVGFVELLKAFFESGLVVWRGFVGMSFGGELEETLLERFGIEPGTWFEAETSEVVRHCGGQALKLSPHEHEVAAFGFVTLNPPPCSASLKSSSEPVT